MSDERIDREQAQAMAQCKSNCDCHGLLLPGLHCSACDPEGSVERIHSPRTSWLRTIVDDVMQEHRRLANRSGPSMSAAGRNGRWVRLGAVDVDSASIGITDLMVGDDSSVMRPASEDRDARHAEPGSPWAGDWGTGIRFWSGFGDGHYDVWAWVVDYGENEEVDERVAHVAMTLIDDQALRSWRAGR